MPKLQADDVRSMVEFKQWLAEKITNVENVQDRPGGSKLDRFIDELESGEVVESAAKIAMRLGGRKIAPPYSGRREPREALAVIGELFHWCENNLPKSESIDINEVARMLNVSARTVRRRDEDGELPRSIKLGRRRVWARADIEAFIRGEWQQ